MRIAYITDQILPQTATDTKQMVSMASALGEAGAAVTLVAPRRWFSSPPDRDRIAAFYEVAPTFSIQPILSVYPNIRGIEKLAQGLIGSAVRSSRQADVIYTRALPILLGAMLSSGRPVVYETYRPWPAQQPASRPFFRWLGRQPGFLGVVLHSDFARRAYEAAGVPAEKLLTAHNAYFAAHLEPVRSHVEARRACGLPVDRRIVTYAGRLSERKGVGLLLEMAANLPEATFVLVGSEGDGPVERRAARLDNVVVVPWLPDSRVASYLYAADVLVIPPTSGPLQKAGNTVLPIKTFMYLAAGRAILAPDTHDLAELLRDGRNACIVPADQLGRAVEQLRALLNDDSRLKQLGEEARATGRNMTWTSRADKVLRFIAQRIELAPVTEGS